MAFVSTFVSEFLSGARRLNPGYWADKYYGWHGEEEAASYQAELVQYYSGIMENTGIENSVGAWGASWLELPYQTLAGESLGGEEISGIDRLMAANNTVLMILGRPGIRSARAPALIRKSGRVPPVPIRAVARDIIDLERLPDGSWGMPLPPRLAAPPRPLGLPGPFMKDTALPSISWAQPSAFRRLHSIGGPESTETVFKYMQRIRRKEALDPILVVEYDGTLWVRDGHHRLEASRRMNEQVPYVIQTVKDDDLANFMRDLDTYGSVGPNYINPNSMRRLERGWRR